LLAELGKIEGLPFTKPNGAFYMFPDFSGYDKSDEAFALRLLREAEVATAPGSGFGDAGKGHLRISYSISHEEAKEGTERIKKGLMLMSMDST
jgi:aspartate/methionine/tyrosine aminotransferase